MEEAAPKAEAAPEAAAKVAPTRRFPRVPTPVIVTLVGVGLSAWLIPAFTHQWDDRQKAQELKAAIVADMASATARALVGGQDNYYWPRPLISPKERGRLAANWERSSLTIEARMRAYLPQRVVEAWQVYAWLIDLYVGAGVPSPQAEAALKSAARSPAHLDRAAVQAAALVINTAGHPDNEGGLAPDFHLTHVFLKQEGYRGIADELRPHLAPADRGPQGNVEEVVSTLVAFQEELTREVLAAHATGYSTSSRDLLNDLLP
jgi:hypothetical protein